ncbi:hypothetical protein SY89_02106 [Halolamina pelagica]|uniref:Uncharacterized protein n=1 Tax=Halolamina pelagica TaxID=699431 RepID=A0A0P7GRH0_9EURY|nr:hypothetical protein [Halolamina pelagica]KPN31362.1 hypothetical protein SY89_02106 [Halolamina pelagica]
MSDEQPTEACGRCSMTTVVDAVDANNDGPDRDPFGDERIEVDESAIRRVSPVAWMGKVIGRLNAAVKRLTYGE